MQGADPGEMGKQAVDRMAKQTATQSLEAVKGTGESHEFTGADRGEVGRVREQNEPGQGAPAD